MNRILIRVAYPRGRHLRAGERGRRTFYTSNSGLMELRTEISKYLERTCCVTYDPAHEVVITVGGSEAIDIALRAMLDPGDEVLIPAAKLCVLCAVYGASRRCAGDY